MEVCSRARPLRRLRLKHAAELPERNSHRGARQRAKTPAKMLLWCLLPRPLPCAACHCSPGTVRAWCSLRSSEAPAPGKQERKEEDLQGGQAGTWRRLDGARGCQIKRWFCTSRDPDGVRFQELLRSPLGVPIPSPFCSHTRCKGLLLQAARSRCSFAFLSLLSA